MTCGSTSYRGFRPSGPFLPSGAFAVGISIVEISLCVPRQSCNEIHSRVRCMLHCRIRPGTWCFWRSAPGRNIGCYDSAMSDMTSRPDSALESPASRSSEILRDTPPEEAEGGEGGIVGCGLLHNRKRYFGLVLLMLIYYGALLAMSDLRSFETLPLKKQRGGRGGSLDAVFSTIANDILDSSCSCSFITEHYWRCPI